MIWYHLYTILKTWKTPQWRIVTFSKVVGLIKPATLPSFALYTPPWVFSTFFKLYKWYEIVQSVSYTLGSLCNQQQPQDQEKAMRGWGEGSKGGGIRYPVSTGVRNQSSLSFQNATVHRQEQSRILSQLWYRTLSFKEEEKTAWLFQHLHEWSSGQCMLYLLFCAFLFL